MEGIVQCSANFVPLTPISFLQRAATVYRDKTSIIYGTLQLSWRQTYLRCLKLASALLKLGLNPGHIVATLAPNIPAHYELHFSVPMAGAVLSPLNTKLDAPTLALLLHQLEAKLIFVDYQYLNLLLQAFRVLSTQKITPPRLILIPHPHDSSLPNDFEPSDSLDYDSLLKSARNNGKNGDSDDEDDDDFEVRRPDDEFDPISVNYTSGSTGIPKGVIYSHRAAYLNSLAEIFRFDMRQMPVFLWTIDMFRCNGWCLAWTMAAVGGTNIFPTNICAKVIFDSILLHKVTHLCGPPSILNTILDVENEHRQQLPWKVNVIVAGALLNPETVKKVEELGFIVYNGYGMTEVLGPAVVSRASKVEPHEEEKIKTSEGLHNMFIEEIDVKDSNTMKSVPSDGKTIGEVMFRSNILMSGYLKDPKATQTAFRGGWYHTGDVGVRHENGSVQMKDRADDIIISRDRKEVVSTLEVELELLNHPKVLEVAVVGKFEDVAEEAVVICAFVKLKDGFDANGDEIIEFCYGKLPNHMIPKIVVFGEIPVNFNGKVQKFLLREKVNGING